MKNIFLFFLVSFCCGIIICNGSLKEVFKTGSSAETIIQSNSSDYILKFMKGNVFSKVVQNDSMPKVELKLPEEKKSFQWDAQVRYAIKVSHPEDGNSKYDEINNNAVILEIDYFPIADKEEVKEKKKFVEKDHRGLALMRRSTCFGCHADKTLLAGPSFSEMAGRYEKTSKNIKSLAGRISLGSSGVWGSSVMPANPDFTDKESEDIADFILTQGKKQSSWVLPGLEGAFRIIEKPSHSAKGIYLLTASYVSKSRIKGWDSVIIKIE